MNKYRIPTYLASSIYDIDFNKVKTLGYKYLFVDLDNTLASPYQERPTKQTIDLINNLKKLDFEIIVISNNHEQRVQLFTFNLDIKYLFEVKKPQTRKLKEYLIDNNIDLKKSLVIGDQVMTDVNIARHLNIDVILVNPLTKNDEPITFFPRLLDKYYRKKIIKKKLTRKF